MSKSIFFSCVYEDRNAIKIINQWKDSGQLGDFVITAETEDKRIEGDAAIKKHIENKIRGAAIVLVLIGMDTHNHDWIRIEVELANSFHVKIICARYGKSTSPAPPILANKEMVPFKVKAIRNALKEI